MGIVAHLLQYAPLLSAANAAIGIVRATAWVLQLLKKIYGVPFGGHHASVRSGSKI